MSIKSVSGFVIITKNWDKIIPFYKDLLGMSLRLEDSRDLTVSYEVELDNVYFAIHSLSSFGEAKSVNINTKISFKVDSLDQLVNRLEKNGYEALQKNYDDIKAVVLFKDPDGNLIEFVEYKLLSLKA